MFKLRILVHAARNKVGCDEQHPHLRHKASQHGCTHDLLLLVALWAADAVQDEGRERQELDGPDLKAEAPRKRPPPPLAALAVALP